MTLLALQDLFSRYRDKATGVWRLGQEPGRTIYFDYGDAVFAQSTHLQDRLTYILVERGKITQAQMDYALANLKPGFSIGKNLIEMGFITQRDLLEVAKAQVERIICGSLSTEGQEPVFEAKDLDANVVRLPLNTAQVFLSGVLALENREGLLEMLGPLNQVVVLQGRNLMDLTLPPDLAKLPPLLDGTHTLLELSRESMAEPVRLGAFALFLREMGWARLHEMPPLDRHALDLAFTPEPEPLSAPLAPAPVEAFPETVPSLFSTIQEAASPTANLDHLSQALDQLPETNPLFLDGDEEPEAAQAVAEALYIPGSLQPAPAHALLPDPDTSRASADAQDSSWGNQVALGQATLATPAMPLPALPEDEDEPRVVLHMPLDPHPEPAPKPSPAPGDGRLPKLFLVGVLVLGLLAGSGLLLRRRRHRKPKPAPRAAALVVVPRVALPAPPAPVQPAPATPAPLPSSAVPAPPPPVVEPPPKPEPKAPAGKPEPKTPAGKPAKAVSTTLSDRLAAINKGELDLAVREGEARAKEIPASHWVLRLEIAVQSDTIRRVSELFTGEQPDLFLLPMKLRDGRTAYQIIYGHFPTREAAEKRAKHLPGAFLADRNRPRPFRISEIPRLQ